MDLNKKTTFKNIIYYLIGFLPLIITFFVYPNIPEQIPSHYSTVGKVIKWGNKSEVLIIPFLLAAFTYFKPIIFKNEFQSEIENKISYFGSLLFIISINFLSYLELYTSVKGISAKFNFYNLLSCAICFIFIFLGYVFFNCNRNDAISIKIPTYLMSDLVWKNLHRNIGSYWISSSLICLPIGILCGNIYIFYILITELIFIMLVPLFIIFYYIKKYKRKR